MGSFTAQLQAFDDKTERQVHEITTKVILEVASRIIVRTPVDTGRLRNSWRYDVQPFREPSPVVEIADKSGGVTLARIEAAIPRRPAGQVHYITNNLPYAQGIEDGGSAQAPAGMVKVTLLEWDAIVGAAVASVKS